MIKVAITGNIASGKSNVEKIISTLGYKVVDTDKINHEILDSDIDTINEIKNLFIDFDITNSDGSLSREKIGKIVFDNTDLKKELESILHKKIDSRLDDFYHSNSFEKVVFVSVPLLFEANMQKNFDKIIFVSCAREKRFERLIQRNGFDVEYAKKRIDSQLSEELKIPQVDYVIDNNSDFRYLNEQVIEVVHKITC